MILASLLYYRRANLALALGVAVGAAVLTGALLVGDSMRGSLRRLTLQRLGYVDEALVVDGLFRQELVDELTHEEEFQLHFTKAAGCVLLRGAVIRPESATRQTALAGAVSVLGYDKRFWRLDVADQSKGDPRQGVLVNRRLARELRIGAGDEIVLQIPLARQAPGDSPLGETEISKTTGGRRMTVSAVVSDDGLGGLSLRPSQQAPLCLFVPLGALQDMLDQSGRINAIFVGDDQADQPSTPEASAALADSLRPTLDDYGIDVSSVSVNVPAKSSLVVENTRTAVNADIPENANNTEIATKKAEYLNLTSRRMILPQEVVSAAERNLGPEQFQPAQFQPALTYLANILSAGEKKIPYSTVTGIESDATLGPLFDRRGQPIRLADDEIVLNDWAARELAAEPGDRVEVRFYEPESTHGEPKERTPPSVFRVKAIVPLENPSGSPTAAADRHLTPEVKGVTDQDSIDNWDLSFELVEKIRPQDEDYWDKYRATPKAFVSLATARRLWSSRFGNTTSLRIPKSAGLDAEQLADRLSLPPAKMGFAFLPIKRMGLAASSGTTSFSMLFLGFSFFLIAAALMLVALLFSLGVEQRASGVGILAATGFPPSRIKRLMLGEAALVAAVGALVGVIGGVAYAALMLLGLRTWWVKAVTTPFVRLEIEPLSLVIGLVAGVAAALGAIWWSLRRMAKLPTVRLLTGRSDEPISRSTGRRGKWFGWILLAAALAVGAPATGWGGEAQAGAFFGSGALVLCAALLLIRSRWASSKTDTAQHGFGLAQLALSNSVRNPSRSLLTIGVVAAASFLIAAISAFRLAPSEEGTGGMELIAESTTPIFQDLNAEEGRYELGFSDEVNRELEHATVFSARVRAGDDASCLNLYRPTAPRVLGLPTSWIDHFDQADVPQFAWAETAAATDAERSNPWRLLDSTPDGSSDQEAIPVVLDKNTAMYSLHLYSLKGIGTTFEIDHGGGQVVRYRIVGLLSGSIFQGDLLISEANFKRLFPEISGYRFFLVDSGSATSGMLEQPLADYGFDAVSAHDRLANFLAVQNTYLTTFQSLGALGLLLGTFGLAVVEVRSVLQRRGELALLRACGFRRRRLATMVLLENAALLLLGLAVGVGSAVIAVLPHFWLGGAGVPWVSLAGLLGAVALVGLAAGILPMRAVERTELIPALRGE